MPNRRRPGAPPRTGPLPGFGQARARDASWPGTGDPDFGDHVSRLARVGPWTAPRPAEHDRFQVVLVLENGLGPSAQTAVLAVESERLRGRSRCSESSTRQRSPRFAPGLVG